MFIIGTLIIFLVANMCTVGIEHHLPRLSTSSVTDDGQSAKDAWPLSNQKWSKKFFGDNRKHEVHLL